MSTQNTTVLLYAPLTFEAKELDGNLYLTAFLSPTSPDHTKKEVGYWQFYSIESFRSQVQSIAETVSSKVADEIGFVYVSDSDSPERYVSSISRAVEDAYGKRESVGQSPVSRLLKS